jgi:hypothetical protein
MIFFFRVCCRYLVHADVLLSIPGSADVMQLWRYDRSSTGHRPENAVRCFCLAGSNLKRHHVDLCVVESWCAYVLGHSGRRNFRFSLNSCSELIADISSVWCVKWLRSPVSRQEGFSGSRGGVRNPVHQVTRYAKIFLGLARVPSSGLMVSAGYCVGTIIVDCPNPECAPWPEP